MPIIEDALSHFEFCFVSQILQIVLYETNRISNYFYSQKKNAIVIFCSSSVQLPTPRKWCRPQCTCIQQMRPTISQPLDLHTHQYTHINIVTNHRLLKNNIEEKCWNGWPILLKTRLPEFTKKLSIVASVNSVSILSQHFTFLFSYTRAQHPTVMATREIEPDTTFYILFTAICISNVHVLIYVFLSL